MSKWRGWDRERSFRLEKDLSDSQEVILKCILNPVSMCVRWCWRWAWLCHSATAIRWEKANLKVTTGTGTRKPKASTKTTKRQFSVWIAIGRRPMTHQHRLAVAVSFRRSKNRSHWIPIEKWQDEHSVYANRAELFLAPTQVDVWSQYFNEAFVWPWSRKFFFPVWFSQSSMEFCSFHWNKTATLKI